MTFAVSSLLLAGALYGIVMRLSRVCERPMPFEDYMHWVERRCGADCEWCATMSHFIEEEDRRGDGPYRT